MELKKQNILDNLREAWFPSCKTNHNIEYSITVEMASGAFITLIISIGLACIVLCIQSITIKSVITKRTNKTFEFQNIKSTNSGLCSDEKVLSNWLIYANFNNFLIIFFF